MNKENIKNKLSEKTGMTKIKSGEVLDNLIEIFEEALLNDDKITITDFGTFYTKIQKGKIGKIPGTTKTYKSDDKKVVKFKVGKALKDKILK
jgi:DNA-binding protein HU-beta